jgi:hypothetical protein
VYSQGYIAILHSRGEAVVNRVKLVLEQDEYSALLKVAVSELRNPADQIRHILRQDLTRRGLLPSDAPTPATPTTIPQAVQQ